MCIPCWIPLLLFFLSPAEASPFETALRATVKLERNGVCGTAFVVRKGEAHFLVTAAHVFDDFTGEQCVLVYRAAREGKPSQRSEVEVPIRKGMKALWKAHPSHDLAILEFSLPEDADCIPFAFSSLAAADGAEAGRIFVGQDVCIPCYPVKTEANEAGWPVLRRGTIATHPLTPLSIAPTFFVDSSSFGGESGAPVVAWEGERAFVVGVITSMQRQTDTTVTPLEERTVHTPLGLGIAVQSPFLRELFP